MKTRIASYYVSYCCKCRITQLAFQLKYGRNKVIIDMKVRIWVHLFSPLSPLLFLVVFSLIKSPRNPCLIHRKGEWHVETRAVAPPKRRCWNNTSHNTDEIVSLRPIGQKCPTSTARVTIPFPFPHRYEKPRAVYVPAPSASGGTRRYRSYWLQMRTVWQMHIFEWTILKKNPLEILTRLPLFEIPTTDTSILTPVRVGLVTTHYLETLPYRSAHCKRLWIRHVRNKMETQPPCWQVIY